jgi:PBSX family phage terminase large subunit
MILTPAQNKIAEDVHRFRVVNCGRRFGKTTLAIEEIKGKAVSKPRRIAYIAPTYQQARDIAWEQLKNELRPAILSVNESRLELKVRTLKGGETLIVLRGWEAIETLRGQQFDFIVIDEIASMRNFWLAWNEVVRPTLTDTRGEALFISTPKGFNHFYDLYNFQEKDEDYKSFHFTTYDNTHIPKDEIDKAKKELPEDKFSQEYMADFRKTQGLVYKDFDRTKHVYDKKEFNSAETLVGIDWGWTNPAAILKVVRDTDSNYYVTREWYKTGKTTDEIIEMAKSFAGNKYYPDPAEPDRIDLARRLGLNVRDVSKDIEAGIVAVQELFKTNRLFIHSS